MLFRLVPLHAAQSSSALREQVLQHESGGDLPGAQALLQRDASNGDPAALKALTEFLTRHNLAGSREAYLHWAEADPDASRKQTALRQLVLTDFIANRPDLAADIERYRAAGGNDLTLPDKSKARASYSTVMLPGPLSSFARMAALSPDLAPEELLPSLARNVVTNGFEASGNEVLTPTEYLRLVTRYLGQARELQALVDKDRKIVIPECDSEQTGNLLKILGYRMRGTCGGDLVLETVNPSRAFLTVDSGFPLTVLEQSLRANHPFQFAYAPTPIPVLYDQKYWLTAAGRNGQSDFMDAFLSDPSLCRLYLGLSHLDRQTAQALRAQAPPNKLKAFAHVLDFFGGMFQIRNGAAVVPGSPKVWASLTGASPANPGAFFEKLIATDDGWLASYFDALSRIEGGPAAAYLTAPDHIRRFYDALRGKITSPGPARPVFRSSTELMLLTTALRIDPNGQPHIPGNIDIWKTLFIKHPHGKYDGKLTRSAATWRSNDDVLEALFALSRKTVENEPLRIFLALNDIDRYRPHPLSPETAALLVANFKPFSSQYVLFTEAPSLSENSIREYVHLWGSTQGIRNHLLRGDALGTLQSLVELWRIMCRENMIPPGKQDAVFSKLIRPFDGVKDGAEVFGGGRGGINLLLSSVPNVESGPRQERLVELLVGQVKAGAPGLPSPAENFLRIFDAQRLVSLDALFAFADAAEKGVPETKAAKSIQQQLERMDEAGSIRNSLSSQEKSSYSVGYWSERHIDAERKISLDSFSKSGNANASAALSPMLRDSLVGLIYCYYAPSGAQVLLTNPMFVRSHDFVGPESQSAAWRDTEIAGPGWPASAGGRLTGSLVSLPYALAETEQNFLTPTREQALIWADLVPQLLVNVTVNRWRNITPYQIRWISLHVERGRNLLASAALDSAVEPKILDSLGRFAAPSRVQSVADHLHAGDFSGAVTQVPTEALSAMADDPNLKNVAPDLASDELDAMADGNRADLSPQVISRVFGTPKPTLTHSYQPGLLYLRTFPTLMGYSSRILAESWESNNLYYAALADEVGIPVRELDTYVPEWNRSTIENIFATHLEDWPAILRSLQSVSNNVRQHQGSSGSVAQAEF
jgi:hypothetical protein